MNLVCAYEQIKQNQVTNFAANRKGLNNTGLYLADHHKIM